MVLSSKITQLKNIFNLFPYCGGRFRWLKNQAELNKSREKTQFITPSVHRLFFNQSQREWMVFALQMYSNIFKRFQSFLKAFASCYSIYSNCINLSNFSSQATRLLQQNVSF